MILKILGQTSKGKSDNFAFENRKFDEKIEIFSARPNGLPWDLRDVISCAKSDLENVVYI
jgi:hypothetical protein